MDTMKFLLVGISPLLCHNGQMANPLNPWVRELNLETKKGRGLKDEEALEKIARLEFLGSLYTSLNGDEKAVIGIPHHVVFTTIRNGARAFKKGKTVESGVYVRGFFPIEYDGPQDPKELFDFKDDLGIRTFVDQRMVGVQRSKVLRTRPIFNEWSLPIEFTVDPEIVEPTEVLTYIQTAGIRHGIGDARSLGYGRFEVE